MLDESFVPFAIADDLINRDRAQPMISTKPDESCAPRSGMPLSPTTSASIPAGCASRQPAQIDRSLGVPAALKHAAGLCRKWEDMA